MNHSLTREKLGDGLHFSTVTDPKFKHNRLSVNFITPLAAETAAENAILPFLLTKGSKDCPDYTQLEKRLCALYGATLDADVAKFGQYQLLSISIQGIDGRYALEGENLLEECAKLLCELAFRPNITDGTFPEKELELERQFLLDTIAAEINDKRSYALTRCKSHMCKGEPTALRKYGEPEQVEAITPASAAAAYRRLLETAAIEVVFVGPGSPQFAKELFTKSLNARPKALTSYTCAQRVEKADQQRDFTESMEVSQGKLVLGFRTGTLADYRSLTPLRMMVALLGGTPFSRLFVYVREKLSLCYYCAARFDISTGILTVDSGVEFENKQKAQDEILHQLKIVQQGEFTDEEMENTRLAMASSLRSTTDSQSGMESWYLTQILLGSAVSPEEEAQALDAVNKQKLLEAAKAVTLDTVYFLTGKEAEANA